MNSPNQEVISLLSAAPGTQHAEYPKGQFIYLPNDPSRHIYVLSRGCIKIGGYASSGQEVMFDCLTPHEFFGNLQYLEGDFFTEFAKTLVASAVLAIPLSSFKQIVSENKQVAAWLHEIMTLRWWRAENRLFKISSEKPHARIKDLVPMLKQQVEDSEGRKVELVQLLSYQDLADLSGLSRQSVARILKTLTAENKTNEIKLL